MEAAEDAKGAEVVCDGSQSPPLVGAGDGCPASPPSPRQENVVSNSESATDPDTAADRSNAAHFQHQVVDEQESGHVAAEASPVERPPEEQPHIENNEEGNVLLHQRPAIQHPAPGAASRYDDLDKSVTESPVKAAHHHNSAGQVEANVDEDRVVAGDEEPNDEDNAMCSVPPISDPSNVDQHVEESIIAVPEAPPSPAVAVASAGRPPTASSKLLSRSATSKSPKSNNNSAALRPSSGKSVASDVSATSTEGAPLRTLHSSYRIPPASRGNSAGLHKTRVPSASNGREKGSAGVANTGKATRINIEMLLNELAPIELTLNSSNDNNNNNSEGGRESFVSVHPELAELISIANQQLRRLPSALAGVLQHDSPRSRDIMATLCAFLATIVSSDAAVHSSPSSSGGSLPADITQGEAGRIEGDPAAAATKQRPLPRNIQKDRPERSRSNAQRTDAALQAFFPVPTIVQAIPNADATMLDIARVVHDGSRRVILQQVPLSVELVAITLEEKRSTLNRLLQQQQQSHRLAVEQRAGDELGRGASGSPAKAAAALHQQRQQLQQVDAGTSPAAADPMDAVRLVASIKAAISDVAVSQEHAALVQLYIDASTSLVGLPNAKKTTTTTQAPAGGGRPYHSSTTSLLHTAHEDLNRQLRDVEGQLRELRNVPSAIAATKAHMQSRHVSVDKEDLLGRDRLVIRSGLDTVEMCIKERSNLLQLVREERRTFQASAMSLRSSTAGRDDEIAAKNAQLKQLSHYYREAVAENDELRKMVRVLVDHVEQLERRIEASKRLPPQPVRSVWVGGGEGVETLMSRQGSLCQLQSLNVSYDSDGPRPLSSSVRGRGVGAMAEHSSRGESPPLEGGGGPNGSPSRRGSATNRSPSPTSPSIYNTAPDLSVPRRLSMDQQTDLSDRLHDKPVRIRRRYDDVVSSKRYAKQRTLSPPALCTKAHEGSSPSTSSKGKGGAVLDDDGNDDAPPPPTVEELNLRFYKERKDIRRRTMEKLYRALESKEQEAEALRPLRLKGRPDCTAEDVRATVAHLYQGSVAHQVATRAKLFDELVLEKERPYSPKRLGRDELDAAVKRLSTK